MAKVKDFYDRLNEIAPFEAAYSWDNCGLLIGDADRIVNKVLLSLDITDKIAEYAIFNEIDLIISHHPVIFQNIKNIRQKRLLRLIESKIAVISAHTNLDVSRRGVNFVLAETLGLQNIKPLSMSGDIQQYQVCVYTPVEYLEAVMSAMNKAGAGIMGNYSHCATYFETDGQYMPLLNSSPFAGKQGKVEKVKEIKLEVTCEATCLQKVQKAMFNAHPYEIPAYTVIPLKQNSPNFGLGCYGDVYCSHAHGKDITSDFSEHESMTLKKFSTHVKDKLEAPFVKLWLAGKNEDLPVKKIAVCGGSGNSIIAEAMQKADVFVSADFSYHQFLDAPMPVIDAGHFFTENPVIEKLQKFFDDFDCEILIIGQKEHDIGSLMIR